MNEIQTRSQFNVRRVIFRRSLISRQILGFSGLAGKNRKFGFQTLLVGITFRGFNVEYLKVTKMEAIWSFSLHCLQPISLNFSNVKKEYVFAGLCWREFVFTGFNYHRSTKNLRNLRQLDPT